MSVLAAISRLAAGLTAMSLVLQAQTPSRELRLVEDQRVGALDGVGRFGGVQAFAPDGTGGFAVSDIVFRELRFYDRAGQMRWSKPIPPRQGYIGLAVDRDTVAVLDEGPETRLLILTTPRGDPVDGMPLRQEPGTQWRLLGGRSGGWLLLHTRSHELVGRRLDALERVTYSAVRANSQTGRLDTVKTVVDSSPSVVVARSGGVAQRIRPPFWQAPVFAADRQSLLTMSAGTVVLSPISPGDAVTVPLTTGVDSITDSDRERLLTQIIAASASDSARIREVAAMRKLPMPPAFPAGRALQPSPDSGFAVIKYRRPDTPAAGSQQLNLFDRQGAPIGYVKVPAAEQVVGFDGQYLFVVRTDRTRVSATVEGRPRPLQHVVRYRIDR